MNHKLCFTSLKPVAVFLYKLLHVFSCLIVAFLFLCHVKASAQWSSIKPGRYDTTWWNRAPIRLIQTNLPEIDALMDVDAYVKSIEDASANVVLLNVGGIVANYPTNLPFHFRNPYLKGDLVGELVKRLHAKGIRVIGRFDFSKINETLATQKPEWLYVSTAGKSMIENGQVQTCVNGNYQQEYSLKIINEVITTYPLDGIFFNMIGYKTFDYSLNYYGICQCENCKKRFHDSAGMKLPVKEDVNDPVFRRYTAFKKTTSAELFGRIRDLAKNHDPNLIICTYTDAGVDLVRMESSSWLASENESPWNYFSTDHVKSVLGSHSDKFPSNLLQYFLAIPYRHIATSPSLSRVWVLENMLNGAPLDVYVIGTLVNQKDRRFLPVMREIYRFHKANEKLFTNLEPVSKVALIHGSQEEYRGLIKMLSEEHIMFDIIEPSAIGRDRLPKKLKEYDAIILGDVAEMDDDLISIIDNYVKNGGNILSTGFTSTKDGIGAPTNKIRLEALGVESSFETFEKTKSTYLTVSKDDKALLGPKEFEDFDLMMMYSDFLKCNVKSGAKGFLKLLPATMFGPPEKSYYTEAQVTDISGVIFNNHGKGKSVFVPWQLGRQYNIKGHYAHKALFVSALKNLLKVENSIETDASHLIEMTRLANRNGSFEWIGMLNHSGQISASLGEPITIHNTTIRFKPLKPVKEMKLLRSNKSLKFKQINGWVECTVPKLADFEMLLCLYN